MRALFGGNPVSQGYCLADDELRRLRFAVRFPTAVCLPLVATGLALQSPLLLVGLAGVGAVAGVTPRHPFDLLWNRVVRHVVRSTVELPPNPPPRRHAFKLGTVMLLVVAGLFAAGQATAGLALGASLAAACMSATVLNFCLPSAALARIERRRHRHALPV